MFKTHTGLVRGIAFTLLINMNIFILPFYLDRSSEMKKLGVFTEQFNEKNKHHQEIKYVFMTESQKHRTNTLLFYLPLGIKTE